MALLGSIRAALSSRDLDAPGHTPHMTIDYRAAEPLAAAITIPIIERPVEDILLVVGGGKDYHVEVIDSWPLRPPPEDPQLRLF
ncbi:MAG TPA: hypothetical protein VN201_06805 [Roseateles sp.]|nr:hypothetical protein [Roseateles sp.]